MRAPAFIADSRGAAVGQKTKGIPEFHESVTQGPDLSSSPSGGKVAACSYGGPMKSRKSSAGRADRAASTSTKSPPPSHSATCRRDFPCGSATRDPRPATVPRRCVCWQKSWNLPQPPHASHTWPRFPKIAAARRSARGPRNVVWSRESAAAARQSSCERRSRNNFERIPGSEGIFVHAPDRCSIAIARCSKAHSRALAQSKE